MYFTEELEGVITAGFFLQRERLQEREILTLSLTVTAFLLYSFHKYRLLAQWL